MGHANIILLVLPWVMHVDSNLVHLVVNLFRKHAEDDGIGSILFFLWMCQQRLSYG